MDTVSRDVLNGSFGQQVVYIVTLITRINVVLRDRLRFIGKSYSLDQNTLRWALLPHPKSYIYIYTHNKDLL